MTTSISLGYSYSSCLIFMTELQLNTYNYVKLSVLQKVGCDNCYQVNL